MDDAVHLVPYDPVWPALFAAEAAELRAAPPADREAYTDAKSVYLEPLYRRIGVGEA